MDATLRAPFCHCGSRAAAATVPLPRPLRRSLSLAFIARCLWRGGGFGGGHSAIAAAAAALASPTSRGASGVAAAAVTAITVQSLLAVAQRERGSF